MSFSIYVPCNCREENKLKLPPFEDKLEVRFGILDIKSEHQNDLELEKAYDAWNFCEHDQIEIEMDLGQSIIEIKPKIKARFQDRFKNILDFLPDYNGYVSKGYDKIQLLEELTILSEEMPEYRYRFNQFLRLLEVAIKNKKWVYF